MNVYRSLNLVAEARDNIQGGYLDEAESLLDSLIEELENEIARTYGE